MKQILAVLPLLLLTFSCTSDPASPKNEGEIDIAPFFDLAGYITAETERLTAAKTRVEKTITLNGETETQQLDAINFNNDLRLFREADINKPAWVDKYETQTETLSGSHKVTTYLTRDSSLIVHRLMVEEDLGVTTRVEIDRKTGTVLSDGKHQLVYDPARGYSVTTQQTNRFGDDVEAEIRVEWLR
jgi:hypothetical protein